MLHALIHAAASACHQDDRLDQQVIMVKTTPSQRQHHRQQGRVHGVDGMTLPPVGFRENPLRLIANRNKGAITNKTVGLRASLTVPPTTTQCSRTVMVQISPVPPDPDRPRQL